MKSLVIATPIAIALAYSSCTGHGSFCCSVAPHATAAAVSSSFPVSSSPFAALSVGQRAFPELYSSLSSSSTAPNIVVNTEPIDVLVKAAVGQPDEMGDCPFSQRVLLTLEEKHVPYNAKFVDLTNKPNWFLEINSKGKVPVLKNEGKWVADSDIITEILEEKFPDPSLRTPPEKASVGSKIFPSFVKFLKSKDPSDGSEEALVAELSALNADLKKNGPFINHDKISAVDLSLAPKLYHLEVALGYYKKWAIPDNLTSVKSYIKNLHGRPSFLKTKPTEEHVIAGWQKHLS